MSPPLSASASACRLPAAAVSRGARASPEPGRPCFPSSPRGDGRRGIGTGGARNCRSAASVLSCSRQEPRAPCGLHTLRGRAALSARSAAPQHLHPPRLFAFPSVRKCHWLQTISDVLPGVEGFRTIRPTAGEQNDPGRSVIEQRLFCPAWRGGSGKESDANPTK